MSNHSTWKVGGMAEIYFKPKNIKDLQNFLQQLSKKKKQKILYIGLGSNILIRDKGYKGVIINTVGKLKNIDVSTEQNTKEHQQVLVSAESGVTCAKFSREMASQGLLGAEFYSGIPGSMGGAIAMNAGAFGSECWDNVEFVETIDDKGIIRKRNKEDFDVSYRQVKGLKKTDNEMREWFIKGFFKYPKNIEKVKKTKEKIKELLEKRNQTQPLKYANAGSVFKNPSNDYAARLIEASGLKGKKKGGAEVSEKHANFIINKGEAKASDVEELIDHIKKKVFEKFSVSLETEVRIYGEI
jgi:UDP-N-acetylmuramate dehydrogenase